MLGFEWQFVLELFEGFGDIPRHGEMYLVLCIAPVKVYANVLVTSPIGGEGVVRFDHSLEVYCVLLADILDSKIIHHKGESDGAQIMHPQAWDEFALSVTMFVERFFEQDVDRRVAGHTCQGKF